MFNNRIGRLIKLYESWGKSEKADPYYAVEYIGDFTTNVKDENRTEPRSWRERLLAMMIQTH